MSNMRIAILGCGKQADKHISGLADVPGLDIVLYDTDAGKAKQLAEKYGLEWHTDEKSVLESDNIQAVDICTPTKSHYELIMAAVENGKDFFCEKPLTDELEKARQIARAVEQNGRIGMIGYIYRFAPIYETGYRLFSDKGSDGKEFVLGKITVAHFRLSGRGSHQVWKHRRESGGGAINEMLVHMVDLALWYFGNIRKVEVLACETLRKQRVINGEICYPDAEDYILVRLEMETGIRVYCHADMVTPSFLQLMDIQGENGSFFGSIQREHDSYLYLENAAGGYDAGKNIIEPGDANLHRSQMREFIQAVGERRQPSRCTVGDSIRLMETMTLIKQEIRN